MADVKTMDQTKAAASEAAEKAMGAGRQLWLAGLGLLAVPFKMVGVTFETLVEQGKAAERLRNARKYASGGELPDRLSFYFRGPQGKLNLRANNLQTFLRLLEGVDDDTWQFHLRDGDYSRWVRDAIGDPELADELASVERKSELTPSQSRAQVRRIIQRQYPAAA
jgi:hypothetical protein